MRGIPPRARSRARAALGRRCRILADLAKRALGALVIGVATVFLPKSQPDQHWSEPPAVEAVADYDQTIRSGDGTGDGDDVAGDDADRDDVPD